MSVLFVTGAGTDVGKTWVAAGLVAALRRAGRSVRALKPVVSGVETPGHPSFLESDTGKLLRAQGLAVTAHAAQACSPWRFTAPLSPDMAARAEGRELTLSELVGWCRVEIAATSPHTVLLIEGVGGVMSPVSADATVLDWIAALHCPALLVGGGYLGAISHTLTALTCLRARGVTVQAVLVSESQGAGVDLHDTAASLRRFAQGCAVLTLARGEAVGKSIADALGL